MKILFNHFNELIKLQVMLLKGMVKDVEYTKRVEDGADVKVCTCHTNANAMQKMKEYASWRRM